MGVTHIEMQTWQDAERNKKGTHIVRPFLCQMLVSQNQNVAGAGKRMITIANRKAVSNRHPHR